MDNSLEKALREVIKIEEEKGIALQPTHMCYPAGASGFARLSSFVKPVTVLLLLIAAVFVGISMFLTFSSKSQSYLLEGNKELRSELQAKESVLKELDLISNGMMIKELQVRFGNYAKGGDFKYFTYKDGSPNTIIFKTSDPNFKEVVNSNKGIYLYITTDGPITPRTKYTLFGYMLEKLPMLKFISSKGNLKKEITLNEGWVEWGQALIKGNSISIPLKPDFTEFKNVVLKKGYLELPYTRMGKVE